MIGNDIIDLNLAQIESNWKRKGFLDKIFSKREQLIILSSKNPDVMVWNLWSRKEAAYKIYNRITGTRKYNPIDFQCYNMDSIIGKVFFDKTIFYTKTKISNELIYTISLLNFNDFNKIQSINSEQIVKINGMPFCIDSFYNLKPASISHHGRFIDRITIIN